MSKAKCAKCGRIEEISEQIETRLQYNPELKYTCGYCNAETAAKNISDIFDRTFKK